ncbi:hypothetical protein EIN_061290 [Entamoeba invadens IP1]|uniref:hypothetical protein n=1 Tax=Entamoeba invadens IP1 TaxID=370355 RepID=UPI0002C3DF92|nr:hypothetical protein EIN_061290 [Entamoeba invadens IP1]ELP93564.1 hypothetical protein EIN_061290 [Entamoeba invadens IP1]|eukprot:XP_004260335.1 hypothetical protein EIN_061290 [Entamoeba invadens IP1]
MTSEKQPLFKICVIGDEKSGKTSLIKRVLFREFEKEPEPFEEMCTQGEIEYNNEKNMICFYEKIEEVVPEGSYGYHFPSFYCDQEAVIVVCDLECNDSLENVENWIKYSDRYLLEDHFSIIVGVKSDSQNRVITKEKAETYAKSFNRQYFEVSNKTGSGINELMEYMTCEYKKLLVLRHAKFTLKQNKKIGKKHKSKDEKDDKCCVS